jgi:WD40 repeat protein
MLSFPDLIVLVGTHVEFFSLKGDTYESSYLEEIPHGKPAMSISNGEFNAKISGFIVSTEDSQILQFSTQLYKDALVWRYMHWENTNETIKGVDLSINTPYIYTCSEDQKVRVYDYIKKCQYICKALDEPLISIAAHPNGMHIAVASPEKVKPYNIYYDDILPISFSSMPIKNTLDVGL